MNRTISKSLGEYENTCNLTSGILGSQRMVLFLISESHLGFVLVTKNLKPTDSRTGNFNNTSRIFHYNSTDLQNLKKSKKFVEYDNTL